MFNVPKAYAGVLEVRAPGFVVSCLTFGVSNLKISKFAYSEPGKSAENKHRIVLKCAGMQVLVAACCATAVAWSSFRMKALAGCWAGLAGGGRGG